MNRKSLLCLALLALTLPALSGCLWRLHRLHNKTHRAVRAAVTHRWVYYPKSDVYHCHNTKWYWHRNDHGDWVKVKRLPERYRLRRHVKIKHTKTNPWRRRHLHIKLKLH